MNLSDTIIQPCWCQESIIYINVSLFLVNKKRVYKEISLTQLAPVRFKEDT